jgi:3-deoxy-D-manno-octulosonate 8-phosphate phosphatase (KDO 8-P phosphatase)
VRSTSRICSRPASYEHASNPNDLARNVELAVFDIDGVMTDGRLFFTDSGEQIKAFHVRDGLGLKALMKFGIRVAVITARTSGALDRRMAELGIDRVMQGHQDKATALDRLLEAESVAPASVCYTGDDLGRLASHATLRTQVRACRR